MSRDLKYIGMENLRRAKAPKPITPLRMRWDGCKLPHPRLPEGRGEVFFLDILFHRISVMTRFFSN